MTICIHKSVNVVITNIDKILSLSHGNQKLLALLTELIAVEVEDGEELLVLNRLCHGQTTFSRHLVAVKVQLLKVSNWQILQLAE